MSSSQEGRNLRAPRTTEVPHRIARTVRLPDRRRRTRVLIGVCSLVTVAGCAALLLIGPVPDPGPGVTVVAGAAGPPPLTDQRAIRPLVGDGHVEADGDDGARVWLSTDAFSRLSPADRAGRAGRLFDVLRPGLSRLVITSGGLIYVATKKDAAVYMEQIDPSPRVAVSQKGAEHGPAAPEPNPDPEFTLPDPN